MKNLTLSLVVAALLTAGPAFPTPTPDPPPGRPGGVVYGTYTYVTTARSKKTGRILPHLWFRCTVPARWHGRLNVNGRRHCVEFYR